MQRLLTLSVVAVLATTLCGIEMASAMPNMKFCAKYRRASIPLDCQFSSLEDCRAAVRTKGGGHCHAMQH